MASNRESRFPGWALGVIGAVTLLAAAILVMAVVLGVRAGQNQYELRSRQQVGIALQSAIDFRSEGQLQEALQQYQRVLTLDPTNLAAQEGIQSLLALAQGGDAPVSSTPAEGPIPPAQEVAAGATPPAAEAQSASTQVAGPTVAVAAVPTGVSSSDGVLRPAVAFPTPAQNAGSAVTPAAAGATPFPATPIGTPAALAQTLSPAALEASAASAYRAGRWQEAVELLIQWQTVASAAERPEIDQQLFNAYLNLATEKDNEDNLQAALTLYDRALLLLPDATAVRDERNLISQYIEMLSVPQGDAARSLTLLEALHEQDPTYRDVTERLQRALVAEGDRLIAAQEWCDAAERYDALAEFTTLTDLLQRRDQVRSACATGNPPPAFGGGLLTPQPGATAAAPAPSAGAGPTIGRLLYSATDSTSGMTSIIAQPANGGSATVVAENGAQPALRDDGVRLAYRNLRTDQGGISALDPSTGVFFRMSDYTEDVLPSWDPGGNRVVFASNREGDRRWRIYTVWAEERGVVDTLSYGEAPAWHPTADLIAHRGCDETGNGCGLWLMNGGGGNRRALTSVAGDTRPAWSPDGRVVVFMSDARDGDLEIYRADTATGQVVRLTNRPGVDALPTVSPDGQWVAFISNSDGAWKIYAMPLAGGAPREVASIRGDLGDWHSQSLQWVR